MQVTNHAIQIEISTAGKSKGDPAIFIELKDFICFNESAGETQIDNTRGGDAG